MFSEITPERKRWDERATIYEDPRGGVFSLTKYPFVIERVLNHVQPGRILDLGCGPTGRMLKEISARGNIAEGVDLSQKMLRATRRSGFTGKLMRIDTRALARRIKKGTYSSVVSLNSIVPPERDDARAMFASAYHVLKSDGVFIAIVMSHEYHQRILAEFPDAFQMDHETERTWDEEGWQCAFSQKTLIRELRGAGFGEMLIQPLVFDQPEVFDDIEKLYGLRLPAHLPLEEWFVVAKK